MFSLIRNENMKIYNRPRTWILFAILIALVVAFSIFSRTLEYQPNDNWEERTRSNIELLQLQTEGIPEFAREELDRLIAIDQYRLEHGIPPADHTLWGMVFRASSLIVIVTIFTVIIAADIVAGEFTTGTIKLLLIRPASRSKVLLAKYISTIQFSFMLLASLFTTALVLNGFLYGFSHMGTPHLYVDSSMQVQESSMLLHALQTYLLSCIQLVMIVTLAFMISTVFRSSSLAIALALIFLFLGQVITIFLSRWSWGKYWLFANTNLTQYIEGRPLAEGMTLSFSIAVLAAYFILFNALSWIIFNKRDVAA